MSKKRQTHKTNMTNITQTNERKQRHVTTHTYKYTTNATQNNNTNTNNNKMTTIQSTKHIQKIQQVHTHTNIYAYITQHKRIDRNAKLNDAIA